MIDVYVSPKSEALQGIGRQIDKLLAHTQHDKNTVIEFAARSVSMSESFKDFGLGLIHRRRACLPDSHGTVRFLHRSVHHPHGHSAGPRSVSILILLLTGSTLNIMSLMGVIMMTGIVVSNSHPHRRVLGILHEQGMPLLEGHCAVLQESACAPSS